MKNKKQLTREQRYEIEVLLRAGKRQKEIAEPVEKDKSVINRELATAISVVIPHA
jgi:IS30 family transposase